MIGHITKHYAKVTDLTKRAEVSKTMYKRIHMNKWKGRLPNHIICPDLKKMGDHVFCDLFSHKQQVQGRIEIIKEVAKKAQFSLKYESFAKIWLIIKDANPI